MSDGPTLTILLVGAATCLVVLVVVLVVAARRERENVRLRETEAVEEAARRTALRDAQVAHGRRLACALNSLATEFESDDPTYTERRRRVEVHGSWHLRDVFEQCELLQVQRSGVSAWTHDGKLVVDGSGYWYLSFGPDRWNRGGYDLALYEQALAMLRSEGVDARLVGLE